jgi:inorganic triphosphatase YgiF
VIVSRERAFRLKFDICAEEHERLRAAFFTASAQGFEKSRRLAVYLDTPDAILREQDLLWCFSRTDKIRDGRLKAGGWRLDRERGARSYAKKHRLLNRLGGVFRLRLDRELVRHDVGQTVIEIALEHADFRHGDRSVATSEVKFTLHEGEAEDLVQFVSQIWPQSEPSSVTMTHVERGYRLAGLSSEPVTEETPSADHSALSKNMRAADAFKVVARTEIGRALAAPLAADSTSLTQNSLAVRRLRSVFQFFASLADAEPAGLAERQAALQKINDLDTVVKVYLKPAARRGRWEGAPNLVARIGESQARAYASFVQTWPDARVQALLSMALEQLEAHLPLSVAGNEPLTAFMSRELAKAAAAIETHGQALRKAFKSGESDCLQSKEAHCLRQAASYLQDATSFLESVTKGKSSKRRIALQEALGDLLELLENEYHLAQAQTLVADAAAHIARLKQTKTQNAQVYAAAALVGYAEALKAAEPEKALKAALEAISEVKPFWAKTG